MQAKLADTNASRPSSPKAGEGALLEGLLRDDRGNDMVAVHTTRGAKRYRYYISRAKLTGQGEPGSLPRISAGMLDTFVLDRIVPQLSPSWALEHADCRRVRDAISQVVLGADRVVVTLHRAALANTTKLAPTGTGDAQEQVEVSLPLYIKRRQGALILEGDQASTQPARKIDRALVRSVVMARGWAKLLESGEVGSVKELARRNSLCEHYTMRLAPLAYLAPDIAAAILEGRQPRALSLAGLTARPLPINWVEQRRLVAEIGTR